MYYILFLWYFRAVKLMLFIKMLICTLFILKICPITNTQKVYNCIDEKK